MQYCNILFISIGVVFILGGCTKNTKSYGERIPAAELTSGSERVEASSDASAINPPIQVSLSSMSREGRLNAFDSRCNNFIKEDGSYGLWGRQMITRMRQVNTSPETADTYFGSGDHLAMGDHCKSLEHFQSLSQSQQEHVWVTL